MKNKIYINNLDDINDRFSFNQYHDQYSVRIKKELKNFASTIDGSLTYDQNVSGSLGAKLDLSEITLSLNSSLKTAYNRLQYNIKGISDQLDFNYIQWKNSVALETGDIFTQISHTTIIPDKNHGDFNNQISGSLFDIKTAYNRWHNLPSNLEISYCHLEGNFKYQGEQYGKIDGLQFLNYKFNQTYTFFSNHSINLGVKGMYSWIKDDSYIDIWPFTFWDAFLCSRTRLKEFNNNIMLPYYSYTYALKQTFKHITFNSNFSMEYCHLLYYSNNVYKERYFVIYPILMSYHTKELDINANIDGVITLKTDTSMTYGKYMLHISLAQLLPFKTAYVTDFFETGSTDDIGTSSSGNNIGTNKRGGTSVELKMAYYF